MSFAESANNPLSETDLELAETQNTRAWAADMMKVGEWHANLSLETASRVTGSRLVGYKRNGPLYVQKAFYPEGKDLAHIYILHPPGGLVSGDSLSINATISSNSAALITTPGAGRIYGAREAESHQIQHNALSIASGASLEWFPMETLFYSGANGVSNTRVDIQQGGTFMGWDIASLGLPASNQPFNSGQVRQAIEISYQGNVSWIERCNIDANDDDFINSNIGLCGYSTNGVFVAGPFAHALPDKVMNKLHSLAQTVRQNKQGMAGVTQVNQWLAIRYIGWSSTHAREYFVRAWQELRPELINRAACPPRIWAC